MKATLYPWLAKVPLTTQQRQMLRDRRIELGWSQPDLAERVGCTDVAICHLETGYSQVGAESCPRTSLFDRVCKALGVTFKAVCTVELEVRPKRRKRAS